MGFLTRSSYSHWAWGGCQIERKGSTHIYRPTYIYIYRHMDLRVGFKTEPPRGLSSVSGNSAAPDRAGESEFRAAQSFGFMYGQGVRV